MTDRKWLKIGETAAAVDVSPKDLRYWESVIPEIKPRRSKGNLRYYHVDELPRLRRIRGWLREGLTVADCRELLAKGSVESDPEPRAPEPRGLELAPIPFLPAPAAAPAPSSGLAQVAEALRTLLSRLGGAPAEPKPQPKAPKPRARKPLPPPPDTPPLPLE